MSIKEHLRRQKVLKNITDETEILRLKEVMSKTSFWTLYNFLIKNNKK